MLTDLEYAPLFHQLFAQPRLVFVRSHTVQDHAKQIQIISETSF